MRLILISNLFFLVGCSEADLNWWDCLDGCSREVVEVAIAESNASALDSCTVLDHPDGALIRCPDGSQELIKDGQDGQDGQAGAAGMDGQDGQEGVKGQDGNSCTVISEPNQSVITCTDGTTAIVLNGQDGKDGEPGQDGQPGSDGIDGQDGANGQPGLDGQDAEPCTVAKTGKTVTITCPTSVVEFNTK